MSNNCIIELKNQWGIHKKKIYLVLILIALMVALSAGVHAMFRVEGVVTGIDNSSITVTNFFRTQTVDLAGSPVNTANIKVGEKIRIQKNLQGNILYIAVDGFNHGEKHRENRGKNKPHGHGQESVDF